MKKQRPLTASKRIQIAESLHIAIVEKIVHAKIWVCENMIFHGGTSLHLAWNSPRFSEDLDFLTNRKKGSGIQKVVQKAAKQLNAEYQIMDGGSITLKEKKGPDKDMMLYHFVYSHPELRGNVLVKTEFLQTDKSLIDRYQIEIKEIDSNRTRAIVQTVAPVASMQSVFVDKITAIANRPYDKIRDMFDIWWLTQNGIGVTDREGFLKKMRINFDIYNINPENFISDLQNRLDKFSAPDQQDSIKEGLSVDLQNWLPATYFAHMKAGDVFQDMLACVKKEMQAAISILEDEYLCSTPRLR